MNNLQVRGLRERLVSAMTTRPVPKRLRDNFLPLDTDVNKIVEGSLRRNFFPEHVPYGQSVDDYLDTSQGSKDLQDHLSGRVQWFRSWIIPWLNSILPLKGAHILEIGSGTGASTFALAEQGAHVFGLDLSSGALATAGDRCRAFGLDVQFVRGNAADIGSLFAGRGLEAIVFFAVLVHLTWDERIRSLRAAWDLMEENRFLIVIEAPNRLWYTDIHTTNEPFYNWLPDEAAICYSRWLLNSTRNDVSIAISEEDRVRLCRAGRGVSFHEFTIAWNMVPNNLPVISCAVEFHERKWISRTISSVSAARRYRDFLSSRVPDLHPAFLMPSLDLAFRKTRQN